MKRSAAKPHVAAARKYAKDVISGKIPACKWVRLACQRHFNDLERSKADSSWPYRFDAAKAERVAQFIEYLPHVKGRWADRKEPLKLEPWQCFMIASIFGWVWRSGEWKGCRRFSTAYLIVPRKNGKSTLAAAIGLCMFAADGESGAEVYVGATTEKQAMIVQRMAYWMASREPEFAEAFGVRVPQSERAFLTIQSSGSRMGPVIGKPGDGDSVSCAIVDEYHEHQSPEQYNSLRRGMAARSQPLMLVITTAGDNLGGPCHSAQLDLQKILEGVSEDDTLWGVIYGIDPEDDWSSEDALRKANPNYGVSVTAEFLRGELRTALRDARHQGDFKTKHLNVWVGARSAFFNMQAWSECRKPDITPEDYVGQPLYVGLDLASKKDIAGLEMLFRLDDGRYAAFSRSYVPEAALEGPAGGQYSGWHADGWMTAAGEVEIDHDLIEAELKAIHDRFGITVLAYDYVQAPMMVKHLEEYGIECVEVRTTSLTISEPMKTLDARILAGRIQHPGNPCMHWQLSNVVSRTKMIDAKETVLPAKEKPESKIDNPVALMTAVAVEMAHEEEPVGAGISWVAM